MAPLSFDLAPADVAHFLRTANQDTVRTLWSKGRWLIAVVYGAVALYNLLMGDLCGTLMMAVPGICVFFAMPAIGMRLAERNYRKIANDPAMLARYYGPYTLHMDDAGFTLAGPLVTSTYQWAALLKVQLTDTHLAIMVVGNSGWAIPRAAIGDDATREALACLKAHRLPDAPSAAS